MSLMKKSYFLGLALGMFVLTIGESFCFRNPNMPKREKAPKYKDSPEEFYDTTTVRSVDRKEFRAFMSRHRDVFLSKEKEKVQQMKELNDFMEKSLKFLDDFFEVGGWTPGGCRLFSNWDLSCDSHEDQRIRKEFFTSYYETNKFNNNGTFETSMIICPFKLVLGNSSHAECCLFSNQMQTPYRFRIFLSRVCGFRNDIGEISGNWVYPTCASFANEVGLKNVEVPLSELDELENTFKNGLFRRGYFYTEMLTFDCCVKNDSPYFNGIDFSKPENMILDDQAFTNVFIEDTYHWKPILEGISDWYITQCVVFEVREIIKSEKGQKTDGRSIYNPLFPLIYILKLAGGDFRNLIGMRNALWAIRDMSRKVRTLDWNDEYICLGGGNAIPSDYPITVMQQYILTTIGFEYLNNLSKYIEYTIEDICDDFPSLVQDYADEISKRLKAKISRYKNLAYLPFLHFALFSKSLQNQIMNFLNLGCISANNSSYSGDFYKLSKFLSSEKIACKIDGEGNSSISSESFKDIYKSTNVIADLFDQEAYQKIKKSSSLLEIKRELDWMNEIFQIMDDNVNRKIGNLITVRPLFGSNLHDYSITVSGENYFENDKFFYFLFGSGAKPVWKAGGFFCQEGLDYQYGRVWGIFGLYDDKEATELKKIFISPSRAAGLDRVWNFYTKEMKIPPRQALFRMLLEVGGRLEYIYHIRDSFFKGNYIANGIFKNNYITNAQKYLIAKYFHPVLGVSQFYAAAFAYCRNEKQIKNENFWKSKNMFKQSDIYKFFCGSVSDVIDENAIITKRSTYYDPYSDIYYCYSTAEYSLSDLICYVINKYETASLKDKYFLRYVASLIGHDVVLENVIWKKNMGISQINWSKWHTIMKSPN